ncbi:MAG: PspA/IM30 family protein [Luteolibacter sp.]
MFRRIGNLFRGFLGLFIGGLEKANPEALLDVEKENLRKQVSKYNEGLAAHAGLCEKLMSQVKRLETEFNELRAKTTANLKAGNKDIAGQYALRLQTVKRELEENSGQLETAEKTYKELVLARDASVKAAKKRIEEVSRGITDMKTKKAMAELNEMAAGMIGNIGGAGDTMDRLHTMVDEERNKAAGRARVAKDSINTEEFEMMEKEEQALEDLALADFAAAEGLSLDSGSSTSSDTPEEPTREMGS